jgi:hypothetical protein
VGRRVGHNLSCRCFKLDRRRRGGGRSGHPAALAGFPSEVGKSRSWTFPRSGCFHRPLQPPFPPSLSTLNSHATCLKLVDTLRLPSVGITLAGGCKIHPCEDVTPRSSLLRTHSPIPFGSSCLRLLASYKRSSQVATSPCCQRDLPSRGAPVCCRCSLAVSAVSSFVPV